MGDSFHDEPMHSVTTLTGFERKRKPVLTSQVVLSSKFTERLPYYLSIAVLISGIMLRFLYLDADPYYYDWIGYITDEGRWVRHGRSLALNGSLFNGNGLHFFMAPLFQLANYFVFELAGVSLLSSRVLTALCGSGVLVLFWKSLRRVIGPQALLVGLTLLAFQTDLVVLSRVAVPEMVLIFFQLVIYFIIVSRETSSWRMVTAGMLMAVMIAIKLTALVFFPIFSLMLLLMPRKTTNAAHVWRDLVLFWTGFTLALILLGSLWLVFLSQQFTGFENHLKNFWTTITRFLVLSDIYGTVSFPFEDPLSSTFNLWALGIWISMLAWLTAARDHVDSWSHRYLTTSAIWFIFYLMVMLTLGYFPSRYMIHILLPMALFISVGVNLFQRLGIQEIIDYIGHLKGPRGWFWLAIVSAPTATFILPLLGSTVPLVGLDMERLGIKMACLFGSLLAAAYVLYRLKHNQQVVRFFLIFPLVGGMTWALLSASVMGYSFWPARSFELYARWWVPALVVASAVAVVLSNVSTRWSATRWAHASTILALFYLLTLAIKIAPGYVNPHYSMKNASRDLGLILSGSSTVVTIAAESLFNENNLPYKSLFDIDWPAEKPEILVVAFRREWVKDIVARNYRQIKAYDLYVSPEYDRSGLSSLSLSPAGLVVTVYKRNETVPH